jgi:glycine/D-amino acid oxidase-like deaminating enzyme
MSRWARREFIQLAGAAGLVGMARPAIGQAKARVVVIGGGAGGATVAKYLASTAALEVALVEANSQYKTCLFSNLYLAGLRSFETLTHGSTPCAASMASASFMSPPWPSIRRQRPCGSPAARLCPTTAW